MTTQSLTYRIFGIPTTTEDIIAAAQEDHGQLAISINGEMTPRFVDEKEIVFYKFCLELSAGKKRLKLVHPLYAREGACPQRGPQIQPYATQFELYDQALALARELERKNDGISVSIDGGGSSRAEERMLALEERMQMTLDEQKHGIFQNQERRNPKPVRKGGLVIHF